MLGNAFGAKGIAQLTAIQRQLTQLDLSGVALSAKDMQQLVNGSWTSLKFLHLVQCGLNGSSIAPLAHSYWPALQVSIILMFLPVQTAR